MENRPSAHALTADELRLEQSLQAALSDEELSHLEDFETFFAAKDELLLAVENAMYNKASQPEDTEACIGALLHEAAHSYAHVTQRCDSSDRYAIGGQLLFQSATKLEEIAAEANIEITLVFSSAKEAEAALKATVESVEPDGAMERLELAYGLAHQNTIQNLFNYIKDRRRRKRALDHMYARIDLTRSAQMQHIHCSEYNVLKGNTSFPW